MKRLIFSLIILSTFIMTSCGDTVFETIVKKTQNCAKAQADEKNNNCVSLIFYNDDNSLKDYFGMIISPTDADDYFTLEFVLVPNYKLSPNDASGKRILSMIEKYNKNKDRYFDIGIKDVASSNYSIIYIYGKYKLYKSDLAKTNICSNILVPICQKANEDFMNSLPKITTGTLADKMSFNENNNKKENLNKGIISKFDFFGDKSKYDKNILIIGK